MPAPGMTRNTREWEHFRVFHLELLGPHPSVPLLRFHRNGYFTDNCFLFTSTLADAMRSMDVSRSLDSLISSSRITCHRLVYSYVPVPISRASLLVRIWTHDSSPVTCSFSVSPFVSSTRTLTFLAYAFLLSSRRLVYAYHYCLCFSFCSLSTRLPSHYS